MMKQIVKFGLSLTAFMMIGGSVLAQSEAAERGLEARLQAMFGADWSVISRLQADTGSSLVYSDVMLQRNDIIVQIMALTDFHEMGTIVGDQVSVHYEALESFPLFHFETLRLTGSGFGGTTFSDFECSDLGVGDSRPILSFDSERGIAQPDPSLRVPGDRLLGDMRAGSIEGYMELSRQNSGCVVKVTGSLENLQIVSGNDQMGIGVFDIMASLPVGANKDHGSFGGSIRNVALGNPVQNYGFESIEFDIGLPREIIAAYLSFFYDDPERDVRFREIAFDEGVELSVQLDGLDFNVTDFLPGNLATTHLMGDMELSGRIHDSVLNGSISLQMPGAIEMESDIRLGFTDNIMSMSALQAPFVTNLDGFGFEFKSETVLQDIFRMTGLRPSEIIPEMMRERMRDVPLIGGNYENEIDAIETWLTQAEAGERVTVEARPGSPVNMGMIAGLLVVDVNRALLNLGFSASP